MPPGPPVPSLKFGIIEQKVFFEAAPGDVYDALLDSKKHAEFTGSPATTNAKKGAKFTAWDGYISGKNLELVKGKKIVQEWTTTEWPDGYPASRLEFTLTAKRGGTELEMMHSKVPAEQVADYSIGWKSSYWEPLKEYLARGEAMGPVKKKASRRSSSVLMRPPRHKSR
jgi:activator of HSP90 ATPase